MRKRRLYLLKKWYGDIIVVGWAEYRRHKEFPYRLYMRVRVLVAYNESGTEPRCLERLWSLPKGGEYEDHYPHLDRHKSNYVRRLRVL